MLMEIITNKIVEEYGIKVVMVTHSPSSVAYAPESSIYLMQKEDERFRKESQAAAIKTLSDGMIAFSSNGAEEKLSLLYRIINSDKDTVILLEGELDRLHISAAVIKLSNYSSNFEMISLGCADKLKNFIVSMPEALFGTKKVIGIFNADVEGIKKAKSINGTSHSWHSNCYTYKDNVHYMILPVLHPNMERLGNCPLEMLYPISILKQYDMIEKLDITHINNKSLQEDQLNTNDWNQLDEHWCYRLKQGAAKREFANAAKNFDIDSFENFNSLFQQIAYLTNYTICTAELPK